MKSAIVNAFGLGNIVLEEKQVPQIKADEILVKVGALSLNYVDIMIARGDFPLPLPYTLGCDAAGIVEAIGININKFKVGDRVSTNHMQEWETGKIVEEYTRFDRRILGGSFTEYLAVPEKALVKAPANLSLEEISTLPVAALTAWQGLFHAGKLKTGDTVLLQGTGGVSIFALQFAKAAGATVIITSASNAKLARAKDLGADFTINYKENPQWHQQVLEYTGGKGVDVAVEVAGAEMDKTRQAVKVGGCIAVVGAVAGTRVDLNVLGLLQRPVTLEPIEVGSRQMFEEMNRFVESKGIKPVIDKVFAFSQLAEAFQYEAGANHFGKVVVKI